jgi:hypothetical protein
MKPLFL